jgi:hypothetical protein
VANKTETKIKKKTMLFSFCKTSSKKTRKQNKITYNNKLDGNFILLIILCFVLCNTQSVRKQRRIHINAWNNIEIICKCKKETKCSES